MTYAIQPLERSCLFVAYNRDTCAPVCCYQWRLHQCKEIFTCKTIANPLPYLRRLQRGTDDTETLESKNRGLTMFQIERRGTFQILPDGSEQRCGEPWTAEYNWRVIAEVRELTPEGWTIDNHAVPEIIETARVARPRSCEEFCGDACRRLLDAIGKDRCRRVVVEIEGIPGSWIRSIWEA